MNTIHSTRRGATTLGVALTLIVLVLLVGGLFYLLPQKSGTDNTATSTPTTTDNGATTTPTLTSYTSDKYHFSFQYPENLPSTTTFAGYQHVATSWRQGAVGTPKSGTPVISVIVDSLQSSSTEEGYYYIAEFRVGVSAVKSAVAGCLKTDTDEDTATSTLQVGAVSFTHFTRKSAGMSQFGNVDSYRTIHNNMCVAVESIIAGGGTAPNNPSQSTERATTDRQMMESVLQTFAFTD